MSLHEKTYQLYLVSWKAGEETGTGYAYSRSPEEAKADYAQVHQQFCRPTPLEITGVELDPENL